ncbi:Alliinase_C domain-containing protein [Psidium guajava]|nr:Alliinase_C domain-containing protein [Psidium guajava]
MCGTETKTPATGRPAVSGETWPTAPSSDAVINLDAGDPTMYEAYWRGAGDRCSLVVSGSELMSYISNPGSTCWFLEPALEKSIRRIHGLVGNAAAEDGRHVVVGTGSTQLLQAALYALCPPGLPKPTSVVCAAPYYSCYQEVTELLQSNLYKWEGDARNFDKDGPFVEIITSPNNPDGSIRKAVVNRPNGKLVHDLAYYWPHYTPITHQADYDIMLFTFSKCSGHAGSRIGWAIVKDREVAVKMTKFMEVTTIGVSKDSQLRAAKILGTICDDCQAFSANTKSESFFDHAKRLMTKRWDKLHDIVKRSETFSLAKFPNDYCLFSAEFCETHPAFAWLKCNDKVKDCESLLRGHNILTRSGNRFGADPTYVRVSMLSREEVFNLFLERLSTIKTGISNGNGISHIN